MGLIRSRGPLPGWSVMGDLFGDVSAVAGQVGAESADASCKARGLVAAGRGGGILAVFTPGGEIARIVSSMTSAPRCRCPSPAR